DGPGGDATADGASFKDGGSPDLARWEQVGDDVLICHLRGVIDATAVAVLDKAIQTRLSGKPAIHLFDLRAVEYISSTGWGLFSKYHGICSAWNGMVVLCSLSEELYEIYRYLEFHSLMPVYPSKEEALAHLGDIRRHTALPSRAAGLDLHASREADIEETDVADSGVDGTQIDEILDSAVSSSDEAALPVQPAVEEPVPDETPLEDRREEPAAEVTPGEEPVEMPVAEARLEEPVVEEPLVEEAPAEEPSIEEPPGKTVPPMKRDDRVEGDSRPIDVESAISDKNISGDSDLRKLGWAKYGEQLRRNRTKDKDNE
ncbi:MAG: STAS domain-containing protein, partial [Candidatus Latescibacterota bacterium]